jgi:hypothetical protein
LVAGGQNGSGYISSVEIVNLDETDPDLICDPLPPLPVAVAGAIGQLMQGAIPVICGGLTNTGHSCDCNGFENGAWIS